MNGLLSCMMLMRKDKEKPYCTPCAKGSVIALPMKHLFFQILTLVYEETTI